MGFSGTVGAWHTMRSMSAPFAVRLSVLLSAGLLVLSGCSKQTEETRESQPPSETTPGAQVAAKPDRAPEQPDEPDNTEPKDGTPAATANAAAEPAPADPPEDGLPSLTDDQRATLLAGEEDSPFEVEIHYIQSNETRHDLYFPYIEDVGGALIGVGSDQSFTMAAAAKSELMFLMDIDTRVVELQKIYAVLIPEAESPRALVDAFREDNEEATKTRLTEAFSDELSEGDLKRLLTGFRVGRETVFRHLERVIDRTVDGKPASWLADVEMFAHIQDLYRKGRVRIMVGNLAGDKSMRTAAAAAEALGYEVNVLYMSNAEEYFKYTDDFRANIAAMPAGDDSMVLRTIYSKKWVHADLWAYQVQPLTDFQTRMEDKVNRSRNPMLRLAENAKELTREAGPKGLSLVALSSRS